MITHVQSHTCSHNHMPHTPSESHTFKHTFSHTFTLMSHTFTQVNLTFTHAFTLHVLILTFTHTMSHTSTFMLNHRFTPHSHNHTFTHISITCSQYLTHVHTRSHIFTLPFTRSYVHNVTHVHTCSVIHILCHIYTFTHTYTHNVSCSHSIQSYICTRHTYAFTAIHTYSHAHTHGVTHAHARCFINVIGELVNKYQGHPTFRRCQGNNPPGSCHDSSGVLPKVPRLHPLRVKAPTQPRPCPASIQALPSIQGSQVHRPLHLRAQLRNRALPDLEAPQALPTPAGAQVAS